MAGLLTLPPHRTLLKSARNRVRDSSSVRLNNFARSATKPVLIVYLVNKYHIRYQYHSGRMQNMRLILIS